MDNQSEVSQLTPGLPIQKERYGLRNYTLIASEHTNTFIAGCIEKCRQIQSQLREKNQELPMAQIVARVLAEEVQSNIYFPRLLIGGKHNLEDVVNNASCFDISVFAQLVLHGLGIESQGQKIPLLMIPKHYFTVTENDEVIDLFVRGKQCPDGYFKSVEEYQVRLKQVHSLGLTGISKQAKKLVIAR